MSGAAPSSRAGWTGWILGPCSLAAAVLLWRTYCTVERIQWNPPRLTPSFALAAGLNFYGTQTAGPFLGWIYGPVFPLFLAPAALVPGLNASFAVAWGLNFAAFLLPAWLIARQALPGGLAAAVALFFWCALSLAGEVLQTQFYFLHVDTLCVGLVLLAASMLVRAASRPESSRWLHGTAVCAALAIWTKQSAAAVPAILVLWLLRHGDRRLAGRLFGWTLAYAGLLGVGFAVWFGGSQLWFNLVQFHLHNPLRTGSLFGFFGQLLVSSPGWLAAGAVLILTSRMARLDPQPEKPARRMESLLVWLVVGNLPLGLIAAGKVAGGWNSVHSLNYAMLWLALALARVAVSSPLAWAGRVALGLAFAAPLVSGWRTAETAGLQWRPGTVQADDLAYARAHAGRLYLPWNPLITLITDGKIHPFDDALLCLARAGLEPSAAAVRRDIPRGALVVYPEPVQSQFALRYLTADSPSSHQPTKR